MKNVKPKLAGWYADSITGDVFEVIAIDEESDTIEYQLMDGEIGEFDYATWNSLNLTKTEAPEDWSVEMDEAIDDGFFEDGDFEPEDYSGAMLDYDRDGSEFDDDAFLQ